MASAKTLEDMLLSSDIDESAVSALVGSLESQLSSTGMNFSRPENTCSAVNSNHISSITATDCNSRRIDGQKHGALLGTLLEQGQNSSKNLTGPQILGLSSLSSPSLSNAVMVTLAGAIPASGYINQVSSTQQALLNSAVIPRRVNVSNSDAKLTYAPNVPTSHFTSAINSTVCNSGVTNTAFLSRSEIKSSSLPNGTPINSCSTIPAAAVSSGAPVISGPGGVRTSGPTLSAIHNLANIASQQPHILIPSAPHQSSIPNQHASHPSVPMNSNGIMSNHMMKREQLDHNIILKPHVSITDGHSVQPSRHDHSSLHNVNSENKHSPSVHHGNSYQVLSSPSSVITSKQNHSVTPGQPMNVMAQVMTNQGLIPGVQIVNVNPTRVSTPGIHSQKALTPRVVLGSTVRIAPQMIATRPGTPIHIPAGQNAFTIPPGVRGAFFVKTENGQLQLVNVGPGLHPTSAAQSVPGTATFRVQPVPSRAPGIMRTLAPQQMTVSLPVSSPSSSSSSSTVAAVKAIYHNAPGPPPHTVMSAVLQQTASITNSASSPAASTNSSILQAPSQTATIKMSPNAVKKKCKNFLSTLIKLAGEQPPQIAANVKNLIQGLIDDSIDPEEFTSQLQKELNSSPQPCLIPFLKKSLPYLRHSLATSEMTIEGIHPPRSEAAMFPPQPACSVSQVEPLKISSEQPTTTTHMVNSASGSALTAQLSQPPATTILTSQRLVSPCSSSVILNQTSSHSVIKPVLLNKTPNSFIQRNTNMLSQVTAAKVASQKFVLSSSKVAEKKTFSAVRDEDDINDVATMGGVNLAEESQKILASNSELIGARIHSCKDESVMFSGPMQKRIVKIAMKNGLGDATSEAISLISRAAEEMLRTFVEKLGIVAEHRLESIKVDSRYEVSQDVKSQIKFLEELDRLEKKRHEEQEREILLRAAKSRSKLEDPEQLKLKQKAKEMQRAEIEELRQREANMTALLAIGPRKKLKLDTTLPGTSQSGTNSVSSGNSSLSKSQFRPRVKRVNLRDLLLVMEHEKETAHKPLLYKSYMK